MAGNAKPNVEKLGKEGKINFIEYNNQGRFDKPETLIDGDINKHARQGVLLSRGSPSLTFQIFKKSNIWAYGQSYSDTAGSTPKPVNLYKKNNKDEFELIQKEVPTKMNKWYLLFENLKNGIYKIEYTSVYVQFTEWYIETLESFKYLLKQNNNYYTIKSSYYKDRQLTPLGITIPTKDDYKKFGFDDLNELIITKDQKIINGVAKSIFKKGRFFEFQLNNKIKEINNINTNIAYASDSSQFSKGNRQNLITVSCTTGLIKGGNIKNLLNGKMDESCYFYENKKNQWILFNFQESVCIQQLKWCQGYGSNTNYPHGKWILQGSNDNVNFINLGDSFILNHGTFNIRNSKRFKYYKLQQVEGTTTNSPWLYEIEFGINPNILKYLIQYNNQLYIFKENKVILSPSQELTEDNFNINGFNDLIINSDAILNKINNKNDIKILIYTEDLNVNEMKMECKINPYRPIDDIKRQFGNKFQISIMSKND